MATTIDGIEGLKAAVGDHLGYSDWHEITQDRINAFAEATGDHQWIHVDPERAVNLIIGKVHGDYATLRRYLVDDGFLERREGFYWRAGGSFDL